MPPSSRFMRLAGRERSGGQCGRMVCGSGTVKHTGRYGSFLGCSHYPGCHDTQPFKIDRQGHPAATARLRSSIRTTRSHRSQGRVEAGEALPEEATSRGGSSVHAARLSTWWKRPGGPLALTARLSHLQPQTFRQICSPEKGPRYPGSSRRLRSFNQFGRSAFRAYGKVPHVCSPKLTQAVCS